MKTRFRSFRTFAAEIASQEAHIAEAFKREGRFQSMADALPLGIMVSDEEGYRVYANDAYRLIFGLPPGILHSGHWQKAIYPADRSLVSNAWQEALKNHTGLQIEARCLHPDGSLLWVSIHAAAIAHTGKHWGYVQSVEDITARKQIEFSLAAAEVALFEEKERAMVTLNSIGDAVLSSNLLGQVTYLNKVAEKMTGWTLDQAHGHPLSEVLYIIDGNTRQPAPNPGMQAIREDRVVSLGKNCILIRRDGFESPIEDSIAPIHNRDAQVAGAVIVFHDVTEARRVAQELSHLARHDFLTGLPNRSLLSERLTQAIGLAIRRKQQGALLFLDMDGFKQVNDTLGHCVGDQLLQAITHRLLNCVRATDTVCRQGGDEFVILLPEIESPGDAEHVAQKVVQAFSTPTSTKGQDVLMTFSIGISVFPDDAVSPEQLIANADTAMYQAKSAGGNRYEIFVQSAHSGT